MSVKLGMGKVGSGLVSFNHEDPKCAFHLWRWHDAWQVTWRRLGERNEVSTW